MAKDKRRPVCRVARLLDRSSSGHFGYCGAQGGLVEELDQQGLGRPRGPG